MNYQSYFSPIYGYGYNRNVIPKVYRSFRGNYFSPITTRVTFDKILSKTQRSINTINQIIPIYKQVKPIYTQGVSIAKSVSSFFTRIIDPKSAKNTKKETKNTNFNRNNNQSSNPYF